MVFDVVNFPLKEVNVLEREGLLVVVFVDSLEALFIEHHVAGNYHFSCMRVVTSKNL